jgi:hypothetical protein
LHSPRRSSRAWSTRSFALSRKQEFDEQFLSLLTGVPAIFPVDPTDDGNLNDVEKVAVGCSRKAPCTRQLRGATPVHKERGTIAEHAR